MMQHFNFFKLLKTYNFFFNFLIKANQITHYFIKLVLYHSYKSLKLDQLKK